LRVGPEPGHISKELPRARLAEPRRVGAQSSVAASDEEAARGNSFLFAMKIQFKRFDHVQVCIPRGTEEEAREFYGGLLGLEEIEKPEVLKKNGGMWFAVADVQLHVGAEDAVAPSKRHPALEVEDVPGVRAYLERNGVRTKDEETVPGMRRFSFFDPFGNRIELLEKAES
jgi:catechol 2,3-dioxygenase-like lactoylglutathione lyase family enzyme